jgi:hypothetical protein
LFEDELTWHARTARESEHTGTKSISCFCEAWIENVCPSFFVYVLGRL